MNRSSAPAKPPVPGLRTIQRWFATETTRRDGGIAGAKDTTRSRRVERWLTRGPELSAAERLQIYRDGYVARLLEVLSDDYPALRHALGASVFEELARDYIERHPSRSFSLNAYGGGMGAFCRERPEPWAAFAAELARLEWALVEVVHEVAMEGLTLEALASVPAADLPRARLLPSPALRVLSFEYPVNRFFQAFRDSEAPRLPGKSPSATAVYRSGLTLWRMQLEPRAAHLLRELVAGASLETAIRTLEQREPSPTFQAELASRLPDWLGSWVRNGFFVGLEHANGA
jgi:hypothetical protein